MTTPVDKPGAGAPAGGEAAAPGSGAAGRTRGRGARRGAARRRCGRGACPGPAGGLEAVGAWPGVRLAAPPRSLRGPHGPPLRRARGVDAVALRRPSRPPTSTRARPPTRSGSPTPSTSGTSRPRTARRRPPAAPSGRGGRCATATCTARSATRSSRPRMRSAPSPPRCPGAPAALRRWVRHLPHDAPRPRLLDVGCASGEFMLQMRALGWEVHGMDIDGAALEQARAAGLSVAEGTLEHPRRRRRRGQLRRRHARPRDRAPARPGRRPAPRPRAAAPRRPAVGRHAEPALARPPPVPPRLALARPAAPPRPLLLRVAAGRVRRRRPRSDRAAEAGAQPRLGGEAERGAGRRRSRAKALVAQEIAVRRPALAEELVVMGRRP